MSKKPNHTPGPWEYEEGFDVGGSASVRIAGGQLICTIAETDTFYDDEDRANAHLIAAAPDMFEALEAALWLALDQLGRESTGQRDHDLVDQINSALAKARGES